MSFQSLGHKDKVGLFGPVISLTMGQVNHIDTSAAVSVTVHEEKRRQTQFYKCEIDLLD